MEKVVYVDTGIFIYFFEKNKTFYKKALQLLSNITSNETVIVSSPILLTELLQKTDIQADLKKVISIKETYLDTPNLHIVDVDIEIAEYSAHLSSKYNLKLPDSLHMATAILTNCENFYTNDKKLAQVKEISVKTLTR